MPDGVELTAQGTELEVGETATVAYEPRQDEVGALDITVTRLEKASLRRLFTGLGARRPRPRRPSPYFVHATVTNVGDTDLGGRRPAALRRRRRQQADRGLDVRRAPSSPARARRSRRSSRPATRSTSCLVYLAPDKGDLAAVSFRPTEEFDPITWTGELEQRRAPKGGGKKDDDKKGDDQSNGGDNGGDKRRRRQPGRALRGFGCTRPPAADNGRP